MDASFKSALARLLEQKRIIDERCNLLNTDMGSNERQRWLLDAVAALVLIELHREEE